MIVVSNTSPISNLGAIGQLSLLQQLYGRIIIPPNVYQEIINSGVTDPATLAVQILDMDALILDLSPFIDLTDEQFFELCQRHELIRFERNADRKLVLMPLFGGITSIRSANLCYQLGKWNRDDTLGLVFGSSTGFTLLFRKNQTQYIQLIGS